MYLSKNFYLWLHPTVKWSVFKLKHNIILSISSCVILFFLLDSNFPDFSFPLVADVELHILFPC